MEDKATAFKNLHAGEGEMTGGEKTTVGRGKKKRNERSDFALLWHL